MKKKPFIALSLLLLSSCSFSFFNSSKTSSGGESASQSTVPYVPGDSTFEILPETDAIKEFFSLDSTLSFAFTFSKESLAALSEYGDRDNKKWGDVYFPADLTITLNGQSSFFQEVGVRMKGNFSRDAIMDGDTIAKFCHFKVSFKATFDSEMYSLSQFAQFKHDWSLDANGKKERKDRSFHGLEKLDLKYIPRNENGCYAQEVYVYRSFREQGILAPHATFCSVDLTNGISSLNGYFEAIETIDKDFLKRNLGKTLAQGDLYKCTYGPMGKANLTRDGAVTKTSDSDGLTNGTRVMNGKIGVRDRYNQYFPVYDLKTNDDLGEASDFSSMVNFINAMWNIRYRKQSQQLLENTLDVDEFLRFEAISYLFGNFDDQRNNANNYYMYFFPDTKKAIYIPYDWDWCLGWDGDRNLANYKPYRTTDMTGSAIDNNVYYNTILPDSNAHSYSIDGYKAKYDSYIKAFVEAGLLDYANYESVASKMPLDSIPEESVVKAYMTAKKATIASYYGD